MSERNKLQDQYVKQLYIGCGRKKCSNYFCRLDMSKTCLPRIAKILSNYNEAFFCKYKSKNSCIPKVKEANIVLDFYCYVISKDPRLFNQDHRFCEYFKKDEFSFEDSILIEGVLHNLLKKYLKEDIKYISHIIIRVLSEVLLKINIRNKVFTNMSHVFLNVDRLYRELNIDALDAYFPESDVDSQGTKKCTDCLFYDIIREKDFKVLIRRIANHLNNREDGTLRFSKRVEELLKIFKILFNINEKVQITPFSDFYLEKFCRKQDFKEEIQLNKSNYKSLLKYPFILPIRLKSEYLKSENTDKMKSKLQDAFFRTLFEGEISPYFFITVNRNTLYREMFKIFLKEEENNLLKEIKISFKGEEGVDSGGITKEFFQLISNYLIEDNYLFKIQNNVLWFPEERDTEKYKVIGRLIGIALYNDVILNLPFPTFLFKIFLDKTVNLKDLMEIEPEIYKSLHKMRFYNKEEIESLELSFFISRKNKSIELIPLGSKVPVTIHNRDKFIEKYTDFLINKEMKKNIDGIKSGFFSVIKLNMINFLQPCELEKIIVGCNTINVSRIKKQAIYTGYTADTPIVLFFWEIFHEYSSDDKKRLLMFITGNERVSVGNTEHSRLIIVKNGCDTERLPSSQTCFNTFLLPEYSSKEKLKNKLGLAISMTKGFFLL